MKTTVKDALIEIGFIYTGVKSLIPLSQITDDDLLKVGKMICHSPNAGYEYESKIHRYGNSVGITYKSAGLIAPEYFSIYTEKNKPETIGHIEIGWHETAKIDRRKKLYRRGGDAASIVYLLVNRYDVFDLLNPKKDLF